MLSRHVLTSCNPDHACCFACRMGVVKRMGMVGTNKDDRPVNEIKILRCTVNE